MVVKDNTIESINAALVAIEKRIIAIEARLKKAGY